MKMQTRLEADLIVRSFAYVAKQLARSHEAAGTALPHEQLLREAEKHKSALRLIQRDVYERSEQHLRHRKLTMNEFHRMREVAAHTVANGQREISRIAAQYSLHRMAA